MTNAKGNLFAGTFTQTGVNLNGIKLEMISETPTSSIAKIKVYFGELIYTFSAELGPDTRHSARLMRDCCLFPLFLGYIPPKLGQKASAPYPLFALNLPQNHV